MKVIINLKIITSSLILSSVLSSVFCFVFKEKEENWAKIETTCQEKNKIEAKKATIKINI